MSSPDLLVTGASGDFGQRVLHHLLNTLHVPAARIIAASRKPETLAEWRTKGVTTRAADFDDPASLATAFAGAERVLVNTNVAGGGLADVTGDFRGLTGVDPLPFEKWLTQNKAALAALGR
jgi:uncharacterized protein YbjT (DUF2867 family)